VSLIGKTDYLDAILLQNLDLQQPGAFSQPIMEAGTISILTMLLTKNSECFPVFAG
jgi:hypothetical protein